jgi:hypothetical protein
VAEDGSNVWKATNNPQHAYLVIQQAPEKIVSRIEELMLAHSENNKK